MSLISKGRYIKECHNCGKVFTITGACKDYLYKIKSKYYCSYTCWYERKEAIIAERKRKKKRTSSDTTFPWKL